MPAIYGKKQYRHLFIDQIIKSEPGVNIFPGEQSELLDNMNRNIEYEDSMFYGNISTGSVVDQEPKNEVWTSIEDHVILNFESDGEAYQMIVKEKGQEAVELRRSELGK